MAGAGAAVLDTRTATAAVLGTTAETGALAPAVVSLAEAATITVDASAGNDFLVAVGDNLTVATPSNPIDEQKITFEVTQSTGGPYTLS